MKRILSLLSTIVLTLSLFVAIAFAAIAEKTLRVNGMTCGGCSSAVERALKKVDGVVDVKAKWGSKGTVWVKYDDKKVGLDKIKQVITDAGFEVVDK
jgi:copper chaperone CopZ